MRRKLGRKGYPLIKLLGVQGNKVDILPTIHGMDLTELYAKNEGIDTGYMGSILFDKKWKKYVLVELHKDFQMSRDCINEAFDMVEEFWKKEKDVN